MNTRFQDKVIAVFGAGSSGDGWSNGKAAHGECLLIGADRKSSAQVRNRHLSHSDLSQLDEVFCRACRGIDVVTTAMDQRQRHRAFRQQDDFPCVLLGLGYPRRRQLPGQPGFGFGLGLPCNGARGVTGQIGKLDDEPGESRS
jgi:hypothetical protein